MSRKQKQIAVFDLETDPFIFGRVPTPFAAGFYDGAQIITWTGTDCVERLVDFILELDGEYIIYGHNAGRFDLMFMLEYLDENLKIINGRIAECKIGNHILRDSLLILPMALKQHGKTEIDYTKFEKEVRHKHKAEIDSYLRDDLKYLYTWVTKFIDRFGVHLTVAGTAFNVMKKQFKYSIEKTTNNYDLHFRNFYYGGRVECMQTGVIEKELKYYDINSAYPYAMLHEHPQGDDYITLKKLPKKAGGWFAHVTAISNGCLPFRGEKMQYYRDNEAREYFATGWEIVTGLETKTLIIKKVHAVYVHCFTREFKDYVNYFYNEKSQAKITGDKDTETFAKLMMNASYGKFGQDSREFHDYKLVEFGADEQSGFTWDCDVGDFELHKRKSKNDENDCEFYNVATAASITGFVRAFLWRAICNSIGPIYCDTDSLLVESFGGDVGAEIGQWKYEADVKCAYIGGRKFYLLDCADGTTKRATKGFRATPEQLRKSIKTGDMIEYKKDAPAFNIKNGASFVERDIYPLNETVEKIKKKRDKTDRFIFADGEWGFKFKRKKPTNGG